MNGHLLVALSAATCLTLLAGSAAAEGDETKALPASQAPSAPTTPPDAPAAPQQALRWSTPAYVLGGVGAALLISGSALGVVAINDDAELEELCPSYQCAPAAATQARELARDRDSAAVFATVGVLGGALALGIAAYLVIPPESEQHEPPATLVDVVPVVGPRAAGLLGTVRF